MHTQKLIILRGYPGSGKTSVGKQLEENNIGIFIDHNAILTFVAGIAGDDDDIYDEITALEQAICKKLLKQGNTVIVARGFSNLSSIESYESIANDLDVEVRVIKLNVSREKLIERVQSPERQLDFNPTVNAIELNKWIDGNPLENHSREQIVDNERPLNEVVNKISEAVRN